MSCSSSDTVCDDVNTGIEAITLLYHKAGQRRLVRNMADILLYSLHCGILLVKIFNILNFGRYENLENLIANWISEYLKINAVSLRTIV